MDRTTNDRPDPHCSRCEFEQLKALYHLNTAAKKYAESAEEAYNTGWKEQARRRSQRKKALYSLKRAILGEFVENGCVDDIRTHEIDGRTYYCVYVGEFSYHTPISEWEEPPLDAPESAVELEGFDANPSNRSEDMSEQEALKRLSDRFESPNYHLESPFTDSNYGASFVGWSYLPGALEEGDRVPDHHLFDHNGEGDFLFEVGDTFQTGEGECEIISRYHAYLTPTYDRSPLLQRPAYDVLLAGEKHESITERRMTDDWNILAESISDPLPTVDGKLGDTAGQCVERYTDEPVEFEIGDIIELQPMAEAGSPIYCRLTEVHVSFNLLIGQYDPIPPSEEAPLGLTIEEIVDDVVAVHDEPPAAE